VSDRALIVTADDFGLSLEVNEAVEEAHRKGVLTSASLVVTGEAAADAVRRAKKMPKLGVGLHLALLDAPSALKAAEIPDLIEPGQDYLGSRAAMTGARIALVKSVREQARAEMHAQFALFRKTGLELDRVDGHWHFHMHPTVVGILIRDLAGPFGIKAVRVPAEPAGPSSRAAGTGSVKRWTTALANGPLWAALKLRLRKAGIGSNDWFFGLNDTGAVTRERMLGFVAQLPAGVSEIGLHPASGPLSGPFAPPAHYKVTEELAALVDPDVIESCRAVRLGRFADFVGHRA
jgi:hopanoid biosynthesis associated protein HpnK